MQNVINSSNTNSTIKAGEIKLNNINITNQSSKNNGEESLESSTPKKIGRNDPCPCGSGKKYKQCHGSAA